MSANDSQTAAGGRRKRRSSAEIMDRLLAAAREEFGERGFSGATTAAIARRGEVTEAQLFRYFSCKTDLFVEAIFKPLERHISSFHAQDGGWGGPDDDMRDRAGQYISELRAFIEANADMLLAVAVARAYAPESVAHVGDVDSLRAYFDRGASVMRGRLTGSPRVDPRLMVRVSFATVLACVLFRDWLFPPGIASEDEISAALVDFVVDGLAANEEPGLRRS